MRSIFSISAVRATFSTNLASTAPLYDELGGLVKTAEMALSVEKKNEKIRQKNEVDRYRDRLHSKLFNHLKSILYDEKDPRFDDAQQVMRVVKDVGNPTRCHCICH